MIFWNPKKVFSKKLSSSKKFLVIANSRKIFVFDYQRNLYLIDKEKKDVSVLKITTQDTQTNLLPRYLLVIFNRLYFYHFTGTVYIAVGFDDNQKITNSRLGSFPLGFYNGNMIFPEQRLPASEDTSEDLDALDYKFNVRKLSFRFPEQIDCGRIELTYGATRDVQKNVIEFSRKSPCGTIIFSFDWLIDPPKLLGYRRLSK